MPEGFAGESCRNCYGCVPSNLLALGHVKRMTPPTLMSTKSCRLAGSPSVSSKEPLKPSSCIMSPLLGLGRGVSSTFLDLNITLNAEDNRDALRLSVIWSSGIVQVYAEMMKDQEWSTRSMLGLILRRALRRKVQDVIGDVVGFVVNVVRRSSGRKDSNIRGSRLPLCWSFP